MANEVLISILEAMRIVAVILHPITPMLSKRIYNQLGISDAIYDVCNFFFIL